MADNVFTESSYRAIIDTSRDSLLVINPELNCVLMNLVARKTLEVDADSYLNRPFYELVPDFMPSTNELDEQCPIEEAFQSGELVRTVREMRLHRALKRTYEISAEPIKSEKGLPAAVVVILRDVTASLDHMNLQELTAKIKRAKKEWEATMDCVQDFVILVDGQNRVKRVNRPLVDFIGLSYNKIIGQDLATILAAHGMKSDRCFIDSQECEYKHLPLGRIFAMRSFKLRASEDNEQVITFTDISASKEAARQLEAKNTELEQAFAALKTTQSKLLQQEKMASVGQLAAGVAHEINNPIGFVTSNINSLNKYAAKINEFLELQNKFIDAYCPSAEKIQALDDRRRKMKIDFILEDMADLIVESLDGVERVKKIVQNLKNFSRVDQAERSEADINACLEETITIAWNELKYKCTIHKEYGDLPLIKCYPQQLNQVFMNMLVNSAHAMDEPGVITIKTWYADQSIFIAISDTGCGIAADKLAHVFEPFYTTKAVGKGTGLGLSISYDIIVQQHNGEISIQSEEGKGTTFTICLPLPEQEETP